MPESGLALTVVVCTRNRAAELERCLLSLSRQTLDPSRFEVVAVDNGSTDATPALLRGWGGRMPNLRPVVEREAGLSFARNRGWREARAPLVAYLDDDAEASPHWAERIPAAFAAATAAHPGIPLAAVGGRILPRYDVPPPAWFDDRFETRSWGRMPGYLEGATAGQGFSGSNMAFPRQLLEASGGFSTSYGMVGGRVRMGEDTELFRRLAAAGGRFWYDPALVVHHRVGPEHLLPSWRFRRSYWVGHSQARMAGRRLFSLATLRSLGGLLLFLLRFPFALVRGRTRGRSPLRAVTTRLLEKLGFRLGTLAGGRW